MVNIYIVYEIKLWPFTVSKYFALGNYLLGAVKLPKNADADKYSYSAHAIRSDARGSLSLLNGSEFDKNVIIFGSLMSASAHIKNTKNTSWFLVKLQQMLS